LTPELAGAQPDPGSLEEDRAFVVDLDATAMAAMIGARNTSATKATRSTKP
jgi:hypothetical protein